MHIPAIATSEMEVLSFAEAMRQSGREADYDTGRWLYVPDFYTEYRYVLGTKGEKPLICIGVNPSTAEPDHLDNTLKSVERIALGNGYDSFIMFNVYPQRATRPQDMARERDERLHRANMCFLQMPTIISYVHAQSRRPRRIVLTCTKKRRLSNIF